MDHVERQLRIDLAAAYRLAAHFAMDDLIYTHFSARLPDGSGDFLLNPCGLLFDEITASSLIRVSPRGAGAHPRRRGERHERAVPREGLPFSRREWPALLRRLDRIAPGCRD